MSNVLNSRPRKIDAWYPPCSPTPVTNYISETEAEYYLSDRNNYLRTASYRKNYDKHLTGENAGKYIQLDFAYLIELSKLDMYLRTHLLQMCIDIEHALKVQVIADIEANSSENGYDIVESFLTDNPDVLRSIAQKADSIFTGDLIDKYFTRFLKHYDNAYPGRLNLNFNHLNTIRSLRNACAHNNCLLLSVRQGTTQPSPKVSQYVSKIPGIKKEERKNKLSCRPMFEIVCLLMEYNTLVSEQLRKGRMKELKKFAHGRLVSHYGFFSNNQVVSTAINFLQKVIDNFA